MTYTKTCKICGCQYETVSRHGLFCSRLCQNKAKLIKEKKQRAHARALREQHPTPQKEPMDTAHFYYAPCSVERLSKVKERPSNCSPIRWRIELRRRANARYYSEFGLPAS